METPRHIENGIANRYTVPLLVADGPASVIYTAAAATPPPSWPLNGAQTRLFASTDHCHSFENVTPADLPARPMMMQLVGSGQGRLLGLYNDGTVVNIEPAAGRSSIIASDLPLAYDLLTLS